MFNSATSSALIALILVAGCSQQSTLPEPRVTRHATADLAEVRDHSLQLARQYGNDRILVSFDLDNTLLAGNTDLGADQWYDWQKALQARDPCDPRLVSDRLAAQGALFHVGSMRLTQDDAAEIVAEIQAAAIPTMLVTARGQEFRLPTFREMRRNELNFRDFSPGPLGGFTEAYRPVEGGREVRYEDGAYLLAGQHKGDMLIKLYQRLALPLPEVVLFVDDKTSNVNAMAEALEKAGVRGEIYHYLGEEQRVSEFDAEAAVAAWSQISSALETIEAVMGPVNYDLPETDHQTVTCQ